MKLVVSDKMTQRREQCLRIPSKGRKSLGVTLKELIEIVDSPLNIGNTGEVRQAYKEDIRKAKRAGVPLTDVVFVSHNMYVMLNKARHQYPDVFVAKSPRRCGIGSDPEYALIEDGHLVLANETMTAHTEEVGDDFSLLELRPNPGTTVKEHLKALERAILTIPDCIPESCTACSYPYFDDRTCGGHIHLGISSLLPAKLEKAYGIDNSDAQAIIFRLINVVLSSTLAPILDVLDGDMALERREVYGDLYDYRFNPMRFEFRTLSSTWTLFKDLAEITLRTAHTATATLQNLIHDNIGKVAFDVVTDCEMAADILDQVFPDFPTEPSICEVLEEAKSDERQEFVKTYSVPILEELVGHDLVSSLLSLCQVEIPQEYRDVVDNWANNITLKEL